MSSATVVNVSAYKFVELDDLPGRRDRILAVCRRHGLLGTVLLATEGINLFLAGARDDIAALIDCLRADVRLADLDPKVSLSATRPFRRLLVKIKPEIITMKRPAVRPQHGRAPAVSPATVKRWLDAGCDDAGRAVVMLDTRNAFEAEHGRFANGIDLRIQRFSEFPTAVSSMAGELVGKTVVTYCTGGIRCEKAAIVMRASGFENVYQLDGGILRYFEEIGASHWRGDCFVFDEREALTPNLAPVRS